MNLHTTQFLSLSHLIMLATSVSFIYLFYFTLLFFLLLFKYSCLHFPPPPTPDPTPPWFCHVSFIDVPENPSPHYSPQSSLWLLSFSYTSYCKFVPSMNNHRNTWVHLLAFNFFFNRKFFLWLIKVFGNGKEKKLLF